jgi:peptidoglycan/LPS O-acetylase OafA/YrhL
MKVSTQTEPNSASRLLALDILRVVAILLVLGYHFQVPPNWLSVPTWILKIWETGGWIGVDLFFVLSGFLVSGLLFREYQKYGQIILKRFFIRRGLKIYPAFYVFLAFTLVFRVATHNPPPFSGVLSEIFFLQSYVEGLWNHTWSLAVEEHFYILLPLLLVLLIRYNKNKIDPFKPLLPIVVIAALLLLSARIIHAKGNLYHYLTCLFPTHLRLDSLFFGVLISYSYHFHRKWFEATFFPMRRFLIGIGVALLIPFFMIPLGPAPFVYTFGFTLLYLGSGCLLVGLLLSTIPINGITRSLGLIGSHSYSIYLWHMAVLHFISKIGILTRLQLSFIVYLLTSIFVGIVMARLIEYPVLGLRDRWYPSRTSALPSPDA